MHKQVVEWRDADSRARAAERFVRDLLFSQAEERPGTKDLIAQARQLRQEANAKLVAAIKAIAPQR